MNYMVHSSLRALVVGDALMDRQYWVKQIPQPGEDVEILAFEENTGGSAANSAIGLSWLGIPCGFCGCLGSDETGRRVRGMMESAGVDTSLMQNGGDTGFVLSMIDKSGERTMFSYRGSSAESAFSGELGNALGRAELVLISGYMLADPRQAGFALEIARYARAAGTLVALDASPKIGSLPSELLREALSLCDIFLPNRNELLAAGGGRDFEESLAVLSGRVPCIAVKLGKQGALLIAKPGFMALPETANGLRIEAPAGSAQPLDTTGAGDAFNAGFLAALLRGLPCRKWLEVGNWLAGRVISSRGATSLYKSPQQSGLWDGFKP